MEQLTALFTRLKLLVPRLTTWLLLTAALLVVVLLTAPHQLTVVVYKLALVSLGAITGYWIDRGLSPYARPDGYLRTDWRVWKVPQTGLPNVADYPVITEYRWIFAAAMLRRALIMAAVILAMALGL